MEYGRTMYGAQEGGESTARLVGGLGGAAIAGLLAWFHVGPFRWICELEAALLGGRYHPALAFVVTTLLFSLPLSFVLQSLWGDGAGPWSRWFSAWARLHPRNLQLSFLGILGTLVGLFLFVRSFSYGAHMETTLAQIEANGPPSSNLTLRESVPRPDHSRRTHRREGLSRHSSISLAVIAGGRARNLFSSLHILRVVEST